MTYDPALLHVVDNAATAARVLYHLLGPPGEEPLVSLDTETTGCNPKKQSPVGRAQVWCMTLAWRMDDAIATAFVTADWVGAFRAWLECAAYRKVGGNISGYDRHGLHNSGIKLRGIHGDVQRMSKLINPANFEDDGEGGVARVKRDLKTQAGALGMQMAHYGDTVATVWNGKERAATKKNGSCTPINFDKRGMSDVQTLWQSEWRRPGIIRYAVEDAVAGLLVFEDLERKLQGVAW